MKINANFCQRVKMELKCKGGTLFFYFFSKGSGESCQVANIAARYCSYKMYKNYGNALSSFSVKQAENWLNVKPSVALEKKSSIAPTHVN